MKRLLTVLAGLGMAIFARADLTQVDIDNAWFSGHILQAMIPNPTSVTSGEGGGTLNLMPISVFFTRKSNLIQPAGFTTSMTYEQTKIYVPATNQFVAITPRTIYSLPGAVSKSAGSDSGTNYLDDYCGANFFRTFTTAPYNTDEYRFGKFRLRVRINVNGGGFTDLIAMEFVLSPIGVRDANVDGGTDPSGGGITPDDLNDQPVNQTGFWEGIFEGLFIPSEETLNTLRDTLMQWANWGPFGIITYLHTRSEEYSEGDQLDYAFDVDLPMVGVTNFDLNPWSTAIKAGRSIGAGFMWLVVIGGIWRKLHSKV